MKKQKNILHEKYQVDFLNNWHFNNWRQKRMLHNNKIRFRWNNDSKTIVSRTFSIFDFSHNFLTFSYLFITNFATFKFEFNFNTKQLSSNSINTHQIMILNKLKFDTIDDISSKKFLRFFKFFANQFFAYIEKMSRNITNVLFFVDVNSIL